MLFTLDDPGKRLQLAKWEPKRNAYRLHFAPVLGERGFALSVGKPRRLSAAGDPLVKNIPIWVKAPADASDFGFRRTLERGMVRVELLLKAGKPWKMRRKKARKKASHARGVAARLLGLRVYAVHGKQELLAEQVY